MPGVSEQALARFARRARRAAGLRGQVNVLLTSSREMRALNRRFRGKDKPTDVLSFSPADWWSARRNRRSADQRPLAAGNVAEFTGDIVISTEMAVANAQSYQHTPAQELKILILHGILHLAGYDHESDRGQMALEEERLRRQLGLTDGLIRRCEVGVPSRSSARKAVDHRSTNGRRRRTR